MSGILFLGTKNLEKTRNFYEHEIGMNVWLEQDDCVVLQHGNFLVGFCQRDEVDASGLLTFFYGTSGEVDDLYRKFKDIAATEPVKNEKYGIYHFFIRDHELRSVEFQAFINPVQSYLNGQETLLTRRSVRNFIKEPVSREELERIFEVCRYAPTSKNSQSYYFLVVESRKKLDFLGAVRGNNSSPISRAEMAVAVVGDPTKSRAPEQDSIIAAYHFMLTAWFHGLGTCWIGSMDREEVKEKLGIPQTHYVATVTPIGYPAKLPPAPARRNIDEMIKYIE